MNWQSRAKAVIAHSALTNSKRPSCFTSVYPTHLTEAHECFVWDDGNKRYADFICALGTNLFGYANRTVNEAVKRQLDKGALYSLSSTLEVEFAEMFLNYMPFAERVRVLKSGSEGCLAAIRIARAATGRDVVLSDGYHGWGDDFVSLTPPAHGVPLVDSEYGPYHRDWIRDLNALGPFSRIDRQNNIAAVIIEPVNLDYSSERIQYLHELRKQCDSHGVVLIFDETITGLRFPKLSVAAWSGVHPDIIIMGKALANGLPISVVAGKKKFMDADFFVSSTFAGDTLAMAAAMKVMPMAAESIYDMWEQAAAFKADFNQLCDGLVWLEGYPTRGVLKGKDDMTRALFMQEACLGGLLFGPSFFWCKPHVEHKHFVLDIVGKVISKIKSGGAKLIGEMPQAPFAQKVREVCQS
jgi:glutamate-1-semialdehyde 2,1-aminomutase